MILLAEDRKKKTIKLNARIEYFVPIQRFRDAASAVSYFFRTKEVPRRRLSRLHLQLPYHLRPEAVNQSLALMQLRTPAVWKSEEGVYM